MSRNLRQGLIVDAFATIVRERGAQTPAVRRAVLDALLADVARTRLLIGPIAAHAVYNAMVVGYHFIS